MRQIPNAMKSSEANAAPAVTLSGVGGLPCRSGSIIGKRQHDGSEQYIDQQLYERRLHETSLALECIEQQVQKSKMQQHAGSDARRQIGLIRQYERRGPQYETAMLASPATTSRNSEYRRSCGPRRKNRISRRITGKEGITVRDARGKRHDRHSRMRLRRKVARDGYAACRGNADRMR